MLGELELGGILLEPFHTDVGEVSPTDAGKDHWDKRRWDAVSKRILEHGLLDFALLESEAFLPRLLLFLLALLLLSLGDQPVPH